jgi:REP element-mobilizing transposase RayT
MPQPRYTQIDIEATADYHVISRCVRRAFLCGYDRGSARSFDHRKAWVREKLAALTAIFAVRIHSYSILSNHFHLVLRIESAAARGWTDGDVVARYARLFPRTAGRWPELSARQQAQLVAVWRVRLADLSWFMRCLNESIARRANREDGCTGHFWEGRFRSQALLDEAALLTCMSYVDLNPIRAGLADSLASSDFTSIQQRIAERTAAHASDSVVTPRIPVLSRFATEGDVDPDLPIDLESYTDLLAATGAAVRSSSRDSRLGAAHERVLKQVGIRSVHWIEAVREYHRRFFAMVGTVQHMAVYCARIDRERAKGTRWASKVFRPAA